MSNTIRAHRIFPPILWGICTALLIVYSAFAIFQEEFRHYSYPFLVPILFIINLIFLIMNLTKITLKFSDRGITTHNNRIPWDSCTLSLVPIFGGEYGETVDYYYKIGFWFNNRMHSYWISSSEKNERVLRVCCGDLPQLPQIMRREMESGNEFEKLVYQNRYGECDEIVKSEELPAQDHNSSWNFGRLVLPVNIILFILLALAWINYPLSAETYQNKAENAFEKWYHSPSPKRFENIVNLTGKALAENPSQISTIELRAKLYLKAKDTVMALSTLNDGITANSANVDLRLLRVRLYRLSGFSQKALLSSDTIIQRFDTKSAYAYLEKALTYEQCQDTSLAIENYYKALLNSEDAPLYEDSANYKLGDYTQTRIKELNPEFMYTSKAIEEKKSSFTLDPWWNSYIKNEKLRELVRKKMLDSLPYSKVNTPRIIANAQIFKEFYDHEYLFR